MDTSAGAIFERLTLNRHDNVIEGDTLRVYGYHITSLGQLPKGITTLLFTDCEFDEFPSIPDTIEYLEVTDCEFKTFPSKLPSSLIELSITGDGYEYLEPNGEGSGNLDFTELPQGLKVLEIIGMNISTLPPLPEGLEYFIVSYSALRSLPEELPKGLIIFDCQYNKNLTQCPFVVPDTLRIIELQNSNVSNLPDPLPSSLEWLGIGDTKITVVPRLNTNCETDRPLHKLTWC